MGSFSHLMLRFAFLTLAFLLGPTLPASGANLDPTPLQRIDFDVELDGRPDESGWQRVQPLAMTQLRPTAGDAPTEVTRVKVAYDDRYIYAVAVMEDKDPGAVRGNSLQRDRTDDDDLFALLLDSFNDDENGVLFSTNPEGTRTDEAISNDAQRNGFNRSWNTYWDAAAVRHDLGWSAEMRIPLSSLRFQNQDGRVVMGLTVFRWISRKQEVVTFPAVDPTLQAAQFRPSASFDVMLTGIEPQRPVHATAYVLAGRSEQVDIADDELSFASENTDVSEIGLDVKYALNSNLNLDLTLNTDFAQVEADDAQVNLTRFSLFLPEKRQFFQERSGLFDFHTGGPSRLFYSRRVGLSTSGEPVPIVAGARLVGRVGLWDVGFMDMQTDDATGSEANADGENFGVLRLRRQVLNSRSYVGGLVTSRLAPDGYNVAWGLDTVLRLTELDELTVRVAQTFDKDPESQERSRAEDSLRLYASMARQTQDGMGYDVTLAASGADYSPDMGFAARSNFYRFSPNLFFNRIGKRGENRFKGTRWWLTSDNYWNQDSQELETANFSLGTNRDLWNGAWFWTGINVNHERLDDGFDIADGITIRSGEYDYYNAVLGWGTPGGRDFKLRGTLRAGTFYDGERYLFRLSPQWTVSKHLSLSSTYEWNGLRFPDRVGADEGTGVDIHLARFRVRYALDNRLSVDLFSQYSNLDDRVSSNLRLRYNFREGTDLYVVYNEVQNLDRRLNDDLELPGRHGRSLLIKYSYTLSI